MSQLDSDHLGASPTRRPLASLTLDHAGRILTAHGTAWLKPRAADYLQVGKELAACCAELPWLSAGLALAFAGESCSVQGSYEQAYYEAQFCPLSATPAAAAAGVAAMAVMLCDVSQRRKREAWRQLLDSVFEHLPNPMFVKDASNGRYIRINQAGAAMIGVAAEAMIGKSNEECFPVAAEAFRRQDAELLASGKMLDIPCEVVQSVDGPRFMHTKKIPLYDDSGKPAYIVGLSEDITEVRRLEQERFDWLIKEQEARLAAQQAQISQAQEQLARIEAERLSQLKDEFLATLSHELRTPLSAILGWAQLLQIDGLDAATRERGLRTIERSAKIETQLVEDLLDLSHIAKGTIRLDVQDLALPPIVEGAFDTVRLAAEAKNVRLRFDPVDGDDGGWLVRGDARRLTQVVWNLLANAIKFTPNGGEVRIALERQRATYHLAVHDTGIGIKPDFIAYVFERFRQGDSSLTRPYGGLGIGLAIVREVVQLHGGNVWAESPGEGLGASLHVQLPALLR